MFGLKYIFLHTKRAMLKKMKAKTLLDILRISSNGIL